ncbi:T9SS type A sorting domain-containing protein [Flavicella sediminum]|uniref:T9SS type A sorting domain-containing protein n=1 Tax=Flavicella sediminum TaxID=2585141 RepID=UPI00111D465B|nr:T9SS type A sorting domain-containing protein [Flavicella sediminum]
MRTKITLITMLLLTVTSFAQPIITAIYSGDCSGKPRGIEIYAKGEVDFTLYKIQNQANGTGVAFADRSIDMDALGTITDEFIYVIRNSGEFSDTVTDFAAIDGTETVLYGADVAWVSGDDAVRIVRKSDDVVIDFYGVLDEDGTGKPWDYLKGYAKRIDGTTPTGAFTIADWSIAKNAFKLKGICQDPDAAILSSVTDLGTYSTVALSVNNSKTTGFSVYPNPANNEINISNSNAIASFKLIDISGKTILTKNNIGQNSKINIENIESGLYIIQLIDLQNNVATEKIVIE